MSVFLLIACSGTKQKNQDTDSNSTVYGTKEYADAFVTQVRPRWFKTAQRFKLVDSKNNLLPHRFFDVPPAFDLKKKTANAIITTPEGSLYGYNLDLVSGQLYLENKFCERNDVMKKYPDEITSPPFSIGVIPRVLDQLNLPQKVIVFGGRDYFKKYHLTHYFDVRIVGAFIEQMCPYGSCLKKDQWNSRLVLVAVQNGHKKYEKVKDLIDLKELVDWPYVKAFIENGRGANKIAENYFPAYRMGAQVSVNQALNFLERNSTVFSVERLGKMRLSCYKMYDYIWKDLSYISADELVAKNTKEIREKALKLKSSIGSTKKKAKPFYRRFLKNFKKYHSQFKTCSRYIAPTNINQSPERHWFFAYYKAFHALHELGYIYECKGNKWVVNPYVAKDQRAIPLKQQMTTCSARDIDAAMEAAVLTLENIRQKGRKSYRYVDYDKSSIGTHHKLYSWVPISGKAFSCKDKRDREFVLSRPSFPLDIKWKKRGTQGKTKTQLGDIIY